MDCFVQFVVLRVFLVRLALLAFSWVVHMPLWWLRWSLVWLGCETTCTMRHGKMHW